MDHTEFVHGWNAGKLELVVTFSKTLQITESNVLPKPYPYAHIFWSRVWLLSIPTAFAVMYFYTWWVGLLMLIVLAPILSKSIKTLAMQFMIDHALKNPEFYKRAVKTGVVRVRPKP